MGNLPHVPGMKQRPMTSFEALRQVNDVASNLNPNNPNVLNMLRAIDTLQKIVAAARELVDVSPRNFAASEKLRKALNGEST